MRDNRLFYSNDVDKEQLFSIITKSPWEFDITGFITRDNLIFLINNNFILPRNAMLNGRMRMDAENYYCQARDMGNIDELVKLLTL